MILTDISRIIELENEAKKNLKLQFTNAAHEFRSPLNSVMPVVQMLIDEEEDDQKKYMMKIILNSSKILTL